MFIYNVTHSVDKEIADEWLAWMVTNHIPGALKPGKFVDCRIFKVLTHEDDQTFTFAVQYHSKAITQIEEFVQYEIDHPFGDKVVAFPTLLEQVHPGS